MIGVYARPDETALVEEFFQLFKTAWEPAGASARHQVLLVARGVSLDEVNRQDPRLVVVFGTRSGPLDRQLGIRVSPAEAEASRLKWKDSELTLCRGLSFIEADGASPLLWEGRKTAGILIQRENRIYVRLGFELFKEVRHLLTVGQAPEDALDPALEIHIDILRSLMLEAEISFVEVLPRPHEFAFICCLTHDVDFYGIRRHFLDRTLGGFLYRALVRSPLQATMRKMTWLEAARNLKAALSLPLVFVGLARDFWLGFKDYLSRETHRKSTFYFIPRKGYAGKSEAGRAPAKRATAYDVGDIGEDLDDLNTAQAEIGLHGLDSWCDATDAASEKNRIATACGRPVLGVRTHWLYFDERTPALLDEAGFLYDSTFGYNEGVGFRAGTGQAFRFPKTAQLLELPLIIQDTALFYPRRMNVSRREAHSLCRRIIERLRYFGGILTVNWHGRSLAPERLWGDFYDILLEELEQNKAFFMTGSEAASWFRARRSVSFTPLLREGEESHAGITISCKEALKPAAVIRCYNPARQPNGGRRDPAEEAPFWDQPFDGSVPVVVDASAGTVLTAKRVS